MTPERAGSGHPPDFDPARRAWIPYVVRWAPETGEFTGTEGQRGFATWQEALEASRFLAGSSDDDRQ